MHISNMIDDSTAILSLVGCIDASVCRRFRRECEALMHQQGITKLVIDVSGVEYFNSSALGMLILAREMAMQHGKTLQLHYPNERVWRVLQIANFQRLFTIVRYAPSTTFCTGLCCATA